MAMKYPTLSIVTVSLNDLAGLTRTHNSLAPQLDPRAEWIVVDGMSCDGTINFLESCSDVRTYLSEPDSGIYDAMRKGVDLATGDFIIFLNAGDTFSDVGNAIQMIIGNLNYYDVYWYDTLLFAGRSSLIRRAREINASKYSVPSVQQSTVYRTSLLRSIKWPTKFKICGDYYIAAQLYTMHAHSMTCHKILANFSLGGVSSKRLLLLCQEAWTIQREVLKLSFYYCCFSFARRLITSLGVRVWSLLVA